MIPNVNVRKSGTGAGAAIQSSDGVLAVIASASAGPMLQPGIFTNQNQATSQYHLGPLPEYGVYDMSVSDRPCLLMRSAASIAATYGTITDTMTGTSVITAGGTAPLEHYAVTINVVNGGTVGTPGITYTYTLDGQTISAVQALGSLNTLTIPNSGVSFALGAGTLVAGDTWTCYTERALLNNSDVTTALSTLNMTRLPWEGLLVDCQYASGTVGLFDTWLSAREGKGQFNFVVFNTRYLLEPTPTAETPATYATAMISLTGADESERLCVGADGGHVVSLITGLNLKRPTALALCAIAMKVTPNIGIDPADVSNAGAVPGFAISKNSNPNDWDEDLYESLDSQRLVTLRSFAPGGPQGTYITNANVLIPNGSDIIWLQYLRVLNKACSIAWQVLNTQLSRGVRTVLNQTTGALNIDERDAQSIEALVDDPLKQGLKGQVTDAAFVLDRDDNLTTPGTPVGGDVEIEGLFYIKGFNVTVGLVKSISAPSGGA